jgi:hypothetical protein
MAPATTTRPGGRPPSATPRSASCSRPATRGARRGETPQDVEAELAALTRAPAIVDDELREEIRQRVVARNARRVRAGAEPLDVDEEVERRIRELT